MILDHERPIRLSDGGGEVVFPNPSECPHSADCGGPWPALRFAECGRKLRFHLSPRLVREDSGHGRIILPQTPRGA